MALIEVGGVHEGFARAMMGLGFGSKAHLRTAAENCVCCELCASSIARRAKQPGSGASAARTQAVNASAIAGGWPRARYLGSSVRLTRRLPRPFRQG